jgi:acetyl-CoA carboxylase alpha subunit
MKKRRTVIMEVTTAAEENIDPADLMKEAANDDLRDENERLKERVAELEAALRPLQHYDVTAAREAARYARECGQVEAADYLEDACDDIMRALDEFYNDKL